MSITSYSTKPMPSMRDRDVMASVVEEHVIVLDSEDEDTDRYELSPEPSQRSSYSRIEIDEDNIPTPPTLHAAHQQVLSEPASEIHEDDDVIYITEPLQTIVLEDNDDEEKGNKDHDGLVKKEDRKDDIKSEKDSKEDVGKVKEENKENKRSGTTTPNSGPQSQFSTSKISWHSPTRSSILTPPSTPPSDAEGAGMKLEAHRTLSAQPAAIAMISSPERKKENKDGESWTPFSHKSSSFNMTPRRSTENIAKSHQSSTMSSNHTSPISTLLSTRTVEEDPCEGPSHLWNTESDDSRSTVILSPIGSQIEDANTLKNLGLPPAQLTEEISQSEVLRTPQSSFSPTRAIEDDLLFLPKLPANKNLFECPDIYEVYYNIINPTSQKIWDSIYLRQKNFNNILNDPYIKSIIGENNTTLSVANAVNDRTDKSDVVGVNNFATEQKQLPPKKRNTVGYLPLKPKNINSENNNIKTSQQNIDKPNEKQSCSAANLSENMNDNSTINDDSPRCEKRKYDDSLAELDAGSEQNNLNVPIAIRADNVIAQKKPKKSSIPDRKEKIIKTNATLDDSTSNRMLDHKYFKTNPLPTSSKQYQEISKYETSSDRKSDLNNIRYRVLPQPNDSKAQLKITFQKEPKVEESSSRGELEKKCDKPKHKTIRATSSPYHSFPPKPEQPLDPNLMVSTIVSLNGSPPMRDAFGCYNTYETAEYAHLSNTINGVRVPPTTHAHVPLSIALPNLMLTKMKMRKKTYFNQFDYNNPPRLSTPPTAHFWQ